MKMIMGKVVITMMIVVISKITLMIMMRMI